MPAVCGGKQFVELRLIGAMLKADVHDRPADLYQHPFIIVLHWQFTSYIVTGQWVSKKLAMIAACTKVLADNMGFNSSTRALAVINLCFWIPTEQLPLPLLMLRINANYHNPAFALYYFAFFAHGFNGWPHFHFIPPTYCATLSCLA